MLADLFPELLAGKIGLIGSVIAFILTFAGLNKKFSFLPQDQGRIYAVNGEKSKGKLRGTGIVIVAVFAVLSLTFVPFSVENLLFVLITVLTMLFGFLDDSAKIPWSDYKKGLIDLVLSVAYMIVFIKSNSTEVMFFGKSFILNPVVYGILGVILIWMSVNVTNCTDGVDGLCASVTLITLLSFLIIFNNRLAGFIGNSYIFAACILAYLLFNSSPSSMLMGDAGSRAFGFFLAVLAMKSGHPFAFLVLALVLILDGGLGLVKVFLLRFLKIHILKNTITPLHDEMRKNKGWSDTQVVFRFAIVQVVLSAILGIFVR